MSSFLHKCFKEAQNFQSDHVHYVQIHSQGLELVKSRPKCALYLVWSQTAGGSVEENMGVFPFPV